MRGREEASLVFRQIGDFGAGGGRKLLGLILREQERF